MVLINYYLIFCLLFDIFLLFNNYYLLFICNYCYSPFAYIGYVEVRRVGWTSFSYFCYVDNKIVQESTGHLEQNCKEVFKVSLDGKYCTYVRVLCTFNVCTFFILSLLFYMIDVHMNENAILMIMIMINTDIIWLKFISESFKRRLSFNLFYLLSYLLQSCDHNKMFLILLTDKLVLS